MSIFGISFWQERLAQAATLLEEMRQQPALLEGCERFAAFLETTFLANHRVFIAGNGGSHCDALHFAEEWTGRYRKDRRPFGVLALGEAAHLTCVGNDYGFDQVFARQLEGLAQPGDLFIGLSTSGASENLRQAFRVAKAKSVSTVGLFGSKRPEGPPLKAEVDLALVVPGATSDRIQELHMFLLHVVIERVERQFFPALYAD